MLYGKNKFKIVCGLKKKRSKHYEDKRGISMDRTELEAKVLEILNEEFPDVDFTASDSLVDD